MCVTGSALEWESKDGHWDLNWVSISPALSFPFSQSPVIRLKPKHGGCVLASKARGCLWGMLPILFLAWPSLPFFYVGFTLTLRLLVVL